MADASLTNLQMVRPKGPKVFLTVLGLGVVGAAAWWLSRDPGPVGEPEDPRKLLVVGGEEGIAATLGELGFVAEQGSFDALAAEGAKAGASGEGIEAILHLADTKGIGYVAVADPIGHGISGIRITGDSADVTEEDEWAVFSVGDLGMPPKVTVEQRGSQLPLPGYVHVLRAAFVQDRLANTLFADNQLPMDAVDLQPKIKAGIELFGAYQMLDRRLDKDIRARQEAVVEGETIDPKPAVLADTLEMSESIALADGTVLSLVQGWHLDDPWDPNVHLQPDTELELYYQPADTPEVGARKPCSSLRGGVLPLSHGRRVLSRGGDVLLLEAGGGIEVWSLDVAAKACAWQRKGKLPLPRAEELSWGAPDSEGRVLRAAALPEGPAIHVWEPGQQQPQVVAAPGCSEISAPIWLDAGHIAHACHWQPPVVDDYDSLYDDDYDSLYDDDFDDDEEPDAVEDEPTEEADAPPPPPPEQVWIYVTRLSDQRTVAIPGTLLGEHVGNYGLLANAGPKLDVLAVHPWNDELIRVRGGDLAALFEGAEPTFAALAEADAKPEDEETAKPVPPPVEPDAADPGAELPTEPEEPVLRPAFVPRGSLVAALPGEGLTVGTVSHTGDHDTLSLSPDGSKLVYVTHDGRNVRVVSLDGGQESTISSCSAGHETPHFTADGTGVVFTSHYDGTDRSERVGRLATLP